MSSGHAQPAPRAIAAADLARAKDRYEAAEAAMADSRFADAAYDYDASYALSQDPALLFKLGRAHERAGQCEVAVTYYQRYLREGHPTEPFERVTNERIAACGGSRDSAGSAAAGSAAAGSAAPLTPAAATGSADNPTPSGGTSVFRNTSTADAAGSASALPHLSAQRKAAWLVTGGALAMVALGGVLAYAAGSSENDVRDLYAGFANMPPTYDSATRKRYDDLIDQGRHYQHLSWAAFGGAGAAAVGAALLFWLDDAPETRQLVPAVSPHGAGVSVRF